tara:strand:- start:11562 stop:11957 length:396 start_codon:yes stop_codon:yes gene_type:complete
VKNVFFRIKFVKIIVLVFLSICSVYSNGGTVVCSGKVDSLSYHSPNKFMVKLESMNRAVFFCDADTNWNVSGTGYVTGPESCKTMYSTFLAAKMAGKQIKSMYFDGADVPVNCSSWESWKSASIRHYVLED